MASASDAVNLASDVSVSTRSYFLATKMSLMVFSCVSTLFRFGLSSMKPFTCAEKALTRSSNWLIA